MAKRGSLAKAFIDKRIVKAKKGIDVPNISR